MAGTQGLSLSHQEVILSGRPTLGRGLRVALRDREGQGSIEREARLGGDKPRRGCRLGSCATFPGGVQGSHTW